MLIAFSSYQRNLMALSISPIDLSFGQQKSFPGIWHTIDADDATDIFMTAELGIEQ